MASTFLAGVLLTLLVSVLSSIEDQVIFSEKPLQDCPCFLRPVLKSGQHQEGPPPWSYQPSLVAWQDVEESHNAQEGKEGDSPSDSRFPHYLGLFSHSQRLEFGKERCWVLVHVLKNRFWKLLVPISSCSAVFWTSCNFGADSKGSLM